MISAVTNFMAGVFSIFIALTPAVYDAQGAIFRIKLVNVDDTSNQPYRNTNALLRAISEAKHVSIVQDAANVANKAFSPNPINVKIGDAITWTNDDVETHTVTSGFGFNDSDFGKKFDSGILGYKQTFSHKFTTVSEPDYFCQFHPTMVGKVTVTQ